MSRRANKLRERNAGASTACVVCGKPADWWHHVAGYANAPDIAIWTCRQHADFLDAFLGLAGVKLKQNESRTTVELMWAAIAGLDGLRAVRDGKPELSPIALAAVRLLATHSGEVSGPRPAAADVRHRRRRRPIEATVRFEAARVRALHDLLSAFPEVATQMADLLGLLDLLATEPERFERFESLDPEAVEPLYLEFERVAVELLDAYRAEKASDPGAARTAQLAERHYVQTIQTFAEMIIHGLNEAASNEEPA